MSPMPATVGQLRTKIEDMSIGDYIKVFWKTGSWNDPELLKLEGSYDEYPITGGTASINGFFYFIKVSVGLCVADRVTHHSLTWDNINAGRVVEGLPVNLGGISGNLRSLTGGIAYVDEDGYMTSKDKGLGAFPVNNEWDKYIAGFNSDMIQNEKVLDDVFHYNDVKTWTQDTPAIGFMNTDGGSKSISTSRISRGSVTNASKIVWHASSLSATDVGFRPVFEYREV